MLPELPLEMHATVEFGDCQPAACDIDMDSDQGKAAVIVWWLINIKRPVALDRRFKAYLEEPTDFLAAGLNRLQSFIWLFRPDLQQAFDVQQPEGLYHFCQWCEHHSADEIADIESICRPPVKNLRKYRRHGVNLIGMVNAELGLGEDIRMMARCLDHLGIDYCCYNYPYATLARQEARDLEHKCRSSLQYMTSIFCLPWEHVFRAYFDNGPDFFRNHVNIAYSPWELPHFPKSLLPVVELIDEFWCATDYIARALDGVTDKPVHLMPMAVRIDSARPDRQSFGIGEDEFAFLYIFDGLSHGQRKNPVAAIRAFQSAFPDQEKPVKFLIKTMNFANLTERYLEDLDRALNTDERIVLIDTVCDRARILSLYRSVDAYVSLHRAEGFGRTIVEAMLSGLPVITSAFSGNMDYCHSRNAYLVDGNYVPVGDHYPRSDERQFWFDPDVESAAKAMLDCYENPDHRQVKVSNALDDMKQFSVAAVAQRYALAINRLIEQLPQHD